MGKAKQLTAEQMAKNTARANKKGPIPKKASLAVYVPVLIAAVAARTFQLLNNMDFERGKYIDPSQPNYTLMILTAGFLLMAFILIVGSARDKVIKSCILINPMRLRYDKLNRKIPTAAGYSALLMMILFIGEIFFDFFDLVNKNQKIAKTLTPDEREDYSMLTGYSVGMLINHILMLFVILTFLSIGLNIIKGTGFSSANCAALSTYAAWQTWELFTLIGENPTLSQSSELIYILFSRMTAVLFFLTMARFFNGMERKTTRFWMCFWGYTSSILAAVSVIPRYVVLLIPDMTDIHTGMNIPDVSDVGIIFMTITVVAVFWSTYVYRVMPKLNIGRRRWGKAPMSKTYTQMENIDETAAQNIPPEGKLE